MDRLAGLMARSSSCDGDALGEGADAVVARSPVDLVADGEARHGGADAGDDAGEVVPEGERGLVGEDGV